MGAFAFIWYGTRSADPEACHRGDAAWLRDLIWSLELVINDGIIR